jgi:protein N-terminal methyltransferase
LQVKSGSTDLQSDIGAGIGRITKGLLSKVFEKTDLMEQNATFLEQCKTEVPTEKAGAFYCAPLQEFEFEGAPYNCIWIQWVLLYLIDVDLIALLKRAKKALAPNGVIVIKENHTRSGFFIDKSDNSITRSDSHFKSIFEAAGLKLIKEENQTDFPRELFPVTMYALV